MLSEIKDELNLSEEEIIEIETAKAKLKPNIFLVVIFGVLIMFAIASFQYNGGFVLFFIVILVIIIIAILQARAYNQYNLKVKDIIVRKMFEKHFDSVQYSPTQGLDEKFVKSTKLLSSGNTYKSDDLLSANYKGIGFSQADVFLEDVTSDGKNTTHIEIFKGRWIICDFIKEFEGYHQIRSKSFWGGNTMPFSFFNQRAVSVKFEDRQFNSEFHSYTSNEHEIFYLITPDYMNKIRDFKDYLNVPLILGFIDNKLHILIYNKEDAFESKYFNLDKEFLRELEYQIELIKLVIDNLDLDLDIFR